MIIGRAENHAAHAALSDEGVHTLGWIRWLFLALVKRREMFVQHMIDGLLLGQPQRFIQFTKEQRLRHFALGIFDHAEMHLVTIGLLQNQVRNVKERIGPAGQSDLPRQRFHSFFLWNQINIELDRWGDRLATLLVTRPASLTRVASLASLPGRTSTAALPAFARSALAILIAAGRTVPSLVRRAAAFAP